MGTQLEFLDLFRRNWSNIPQHTTSFSLTLYHLHLHTHVKFHIYINLCSAISSEIPQGLRDLLRFQYRNKNILTANRNQVLKLWSPYNY